jgi:hypothetical protein
VAKTAPKYFSHNVPLRRRMDDIVASAARVFPTRGMVLDIGAGAMPPFRDLLPSGLRYVDLDLACGDVRGRADRLPFRDGVFDATLSFSVLEHLPDPAVALADAARVTRPGGLLVLSTHGFYPYHPLPGDYHRWTMSGLRELVGRWFDVVDVYPVGGLALTISTLLAFKLETIGRRHRVPGWLVRGLGRTVNGVGERLDRCGEPVTKDRERSGDVSVLYVVLARARGSAVGAGLELEQLCVQPAGGDERVMVPRLDHAPVPEHDDQVGHPYRGEPV